MSLGQGSPGIEIVDAGLGVLQIGLPVGFVLDDSRLEQDHQFPLVQGLGFLTEQVAENRNLMDTWQKELERSNQLLEKWYPQER